MAKLYFYYSAMNAGKSTILLQSAYNYRERGMETLIFTPQIDTRSGINKVSSRIGIHTDALSFDNQFHFYDYVSQQLKTTPGIKCILVDEAQFLTKRQVKQLTQIVDTLDIPALTYGLRSDFQGEPFEGSKYLLVLADNLIEIKTICFCGKKAIMNMRVDENGNAVKIGEQIQIGGNERYMSMCRKHFYEAE